MALPNLLHPVNVVVEQISKATTEYDPDTREPIQQAARSTRVTLQGQARWRSQMREEDLKGGAVEGADGYVLFRHVDLEAASVTLQREDRVASIGHVQTDVYFVRFEWLGHYGDQDGPTLLKAFFEDRGPERQTRG